MGEPTLETLREYRNNYETFASKCIKIRDHNTAKILPLNFKRGQQILHAVTEKMKAELGYVRILLLKARRFGGSTYVEGRFYWRTSLNSNRNTFIAAHEVDSTNTLYRMATLMQEQNPIAPQTRKSNAQELIFDTPDGKGLKSEYRLATAKNVDAGRSQGVHYLHISEEGMWLRGGIVLGGLLQCVPDPPAETEIFRESTAKGYGNSFQEDVFEAYAEGKYPYYVENGIIYAWKSPYSDYVVVFIPWFVHEEYTRVFESEEHKKGFIERLNAKVFNKTDLVWEDTEGKRVYEKYNLTLEQVYWREWAIANKCRGSIDIFHEEYPATVEEAFLSSGTNVFPASLCDMIEKLCQEPAIIGDIVDRMGKTKIKPNPYGKFALWERPKEGELYFMVIDAAGGLKKSQIEQNRKPDYTCIDIYNHNTGHQCAQWHGHIDYDMIADLAELIGNMFFRPKACVELMNHGFTVVADLKRKKYPMFCAKPDEPGWLTTPKTKPRMVDDLYQMTRDGDILLRCKETISEMRTFIEEGGIYGAAEGCNDDRVTCGGMASQMMRLIPRQATGKSKKPQDGIMNWYNKNQPQDTGQYMEVHVG